MQKMFQKNPSKNSIPRIVLIQIFVFLFIFFGNAQKQATILYTNDIESVYEPVEAFWNDDIEYIGGIPYLSALIQNLRKEESNAFLFDAGDIFTGALSAATKGQLPFDIYSHMGYDAISVGNHEFEYDWNKLLHVMQRANFPVLCCNIFYKNTDINVFQSYTIVEKDNVKIGLVGLMGVEAFTNTMNPAHRKGLEVKDPLSIAQKYVDELRHECDLIILLTHQNQSAPMQTDKEVDKEVQRGVQEDYEMAGKMRKVDIIIGGHSDNGLWEPKVHPKTGTMVCQTFGQGKYLGYLKLEINDDKKVKAIEAKLIPVKVNELKADQKVLELVEQARVENSELTEVLGNIDKSCYRKYYQESKVGNLFCDILKLSSGADIAIMNSGSLRADLAKGEITIEEVINVYPFVDKFFVIEISGKALTELLEYSYQLTYGIVQFSGLQTKYNSKYPQGSRLTEALVNDNVLDPEKNYTIACSGFLGNGGDGFYMLKDGNKLRESDESMGQYFINYIRENPHLKAPELGRQLDANR